MLSIDDEIKFYKIIDYEGETYSVGDEVKFIDKSYLPIDTIGVITHINENYYFTVLTKHGSDKWYIRYCKKTGRHFYEIDEVFKKL